ncbi:MAG: radical SAM protein [Deltaproteobacteria bacterium]|jgi:radical SAM protein with 4Fe4S-binding SPASM domain|nr:radical SAM protein [Deltaproteobacteria bacterium]
MDFYEVNMPTVLASKFPANVIPAANGLKDILTLIPMLKYENNQEKALNHLAKLFLDMNFAGEAYRAAKLVPYGKYRDASAIVDMIEKLNCRAVDINLEIITTCNLRCPMCSNAGTTGKPYDLNGKIMPLDVFQGVWDKIKEFTDTLVLVGQGETFTHPKIYDILDYVAPKPVHIDTNGNVKLDADRIVRSSIKELAFSLDGVDQRTYERYRVGGNFDKVIENIKAVTRAKKDFGGGPIISLKYVIFKHTEPYVDEARNLVDELGMDKLKFVPCLVHPTHSEKLIKDFLPYGAVKNRSRIKYVDFKNLTLGLTDYAESPHCIAPLSNPQIKVNGDVTICCSSFEVVGNIFENTFSEIWHSEKYKAFRKEILSNRHQFSDCRACSREHINLGHILDGTILEYPKPQEPCEESTLWIENLKIDQEYVDYLTSNNLFKDIEYFRQMNVIHPDVTIPNGFRYGKDINGFRNISIS